MIRCTLSVVAVVLAAVQTPAQDAKPLRVYFVGNSVTDTINYRAGQVGLIDELGMT